MEFASRHAVQGIIAPAISSREICPSPLYRLSPRQIFVGGGAARALGLEARWADHSDIKLVDGGLVLCFLSVYTEKPMSAQLPDLSPIPFPDEKPTDRGKFSPDREYWEQLHQGRYTK